MMGTSTAPQTVPDYLQWSMIHVKLPVRLLSAMIKVFMRRFRWQCMDRIIITSPPMVTSPSTAMLQLPCPMEIYVQLLWKQSLLRCVRSLRSWTPPLISDTTWEKKIPFFQYLNQKIDFFPSPFSLHQIRNRINLILNWTLFFSYVDNLEIPKIQELSKHPIGRILLKTNEEIPCNTWSDNDANMVMARH